MTALADPVLDELVALTASWDEQNADRFAIRARPLEVVYEQSRKFGINLRREDAVDIAEGRKPFVGRYRDKQGNLRSYNPRFRAEPRQDYRTTLLGRSLGWRIGLP